MKQALHKILFLLVFISIIICGTAFAAEAEKQNQEDFQQLRAQVDLFNQAIDELGAASPVQAAELWAKGEKTRNGVFQYSVACHELKKSIINKWGKPEENLWVIGVSSPWVSSYEIVKNKKINNFTNEITIKYYWATSAGSLQPTYDTLKIVKNNNYWCIENVIK